MAVDSTYNFKPHEAPFMAGSPANPDHPVRRKIAYGLIGALISLAAGLYGALLLAALPQIQAELGVTSVEGGWLLTAFYTANVCTGFMLVKFRQQFGVTMMGRIFLVGAVIVTGTHIAVRTFETAIAFRAVSGILASGLLTLGMFYFMQALPAKLRAAGVIIGVGFSQVAAPLARVFAPEFLSAGGLERLQYVEFGISLLCLGVVAFLRLPPSIKERAFEPLDFFSFALFMPGIGLLIAALVQVRIVWWTTPWLGPVLASSIILLGAVILIEHNRARPLLDTRWMRGRDVLRVAIVAAVMRILLSEQSFGSAGLLTVVGMGPDQLTTFYAIMTAATFAGLAVSLVLLRPTDLLLPIVISALIIAIAAWIDKGASNVTRPVNLYVTQAMIAFAAILFLGPTLLEGLVRALAGGPSNLVSFAALFSIAQTLGGVGGTALMSTYQTFRQKYHFHALVQDLVLSNPLVAERIKVLGLAYARVIQDPAQRQLQGTSTLLQQVTRESHILAFNDLFLLIAILASAAFIWLGGRWLYLKLRGVDPLQREMELVQRMTGAR